MRLPSRPRTASDSSSNPGCSQKHLTPGGTHVVHMVGVGRAQHGEAVGGVLGLVPGIGGCVTRELHCVEPGLGGEEAELADDAEALAVDVRRHGEPAVAMHQRDRRVDVERRRRRQRQPLPTGLPAARVEHALLAEEGLVAIVAALETGSHLGAGSLGGGGVGEDADHVALLDGRDLHAGEHHQVVAGHLLYGGDVARAVVVADGDHPKALSERRADDHRRGHGVVRARRERGVDVQVCEADVHAWFPFTPRA